MSISFFQLLEFLPITILAPLTATDSSHSPGQLGTNWMNEWMNEVFAPVLPFPVISDSLQLWITMSIVFWAHRGVVSCAATNCNFPLTKKAVPVYVMPFFWFLHKPNLHDNQLHGLEEANWGQKEPTKAKKTTKIPLLQIVHRYYLILSIEETICSPFVECIIWLTTPSYLAHLRFPVTTMFKWQYLRGEIVVAAKHYTLAHSLWDVYVFFHCWSVHFYIKFSIFTFKKKTFLLLGASTYTAAQHTSQ